MGGGGEIYRQEWGDSTALTGSEGPRSALSMFARHDVLGLLSDSALEYQESEIVQELRLLRDDGAVNLACAFYMEERLANWGCGHLSNGVATQFPLLLDRELARIVFAIDDVSEDVHFEMLRHCGRRALVSSVSQQGVGTRYRTTSAATRLGTETYLGHRGTQFPVAVRVLSDLPECNYRFLS